MKHQEKKYQVDSFDEIRVKLSALGIQPSKEKTTNHYYGQHEGNDVTKLVSYADKNEIHVLKEVNGKFDLEQSVSVGSVEAGLEWLRGKGYQAVDLVKMSSIDYEYQGGLVRLYLIDDWLHSVILDYPAGKHEEIERDFCLEDVERITVPYNKQLEQLGRLRSMELD
ncbi:MAG: hypothetical protein HN846_00125 [Candidatus Pacebacteria bacterium]|jgi:hypothetical protein|nr:hypothetical protein [Candidatus Paceibacterota bacterium]MBT3512184.1 hypothetical protein [Candidatus Paceibacterota bacterium]MBT4004911.1 hypothetical protein [Candidatus Paceibacterota bacterium]MBT4358647.1 hypothetical protein [Candidatus Paceibacterota bacterium]MBT4681358.1 hypothetical protein [Candidatus Paceibacterota bacterium]